MERRLVLGNISSVLLASAASGGTIAAVRDLGVRGFNVGVVSSHRLGAAAWSRHAATVYSAPAESESEKFLNRLLEIGAADPGRILLPTSDETAWMYTTNATLLKRYFRLYQPAAEILRRVLDKKLLAESSIRAGLQVLPTWDPQNIHELADLAPRLPYPVLIKPRTHVGRARNDKGIVVSSAPELLNQYQRFLHREQAPSASSKMSGDDKFPILQKFIQVGREGVHSVTGFVDRSGELFTARASRKVFQRSQPVGVGVVFEAIPLDPALSEAARRLCRELRYF